MPVVGIPVQMLLSRLGPHGGLSREELVTHLQRLGCDVEGYATLRRYGCGRCDALMEITETENPPVICDRCGADFREEPALRTEQGESDVVRMELLAVRPDMFDPAGLARVLRHYLEEDPSPRVYDLEPPRLRVRVDPSTDTDACRRPHMACAVVRGITLTDDRIKVVMKLQENLHWALGRDRKHASIGVYDLETVDQRGDLVYESVAPDGVRFTPLGWDPEDEEARLTPAQVLVEHPKGVAYARLLAPFSRYPLLRDAGGQVLSMPPVINSEQTRVRHGTRDFFIDVTGTDRRLVERALNILVTTLKELDPEVALERVTLRYPEGDRVTPDLTPQTVTLNVAETRGWLGIDLSDDQTARLLRRMGHGARVSAPGQVRVQVPAYRNDILHPVDLMEDVAVAYGYHNIQPALVPTMTVGEARPALEQAEVVRRTLCGLGHMEVITLLLSNETSTYDALRRPRGQEHVLIQNPISAEQTMVRTTLLPGLLDTLALNSNHELPQRIFEVGAVTLLDPESETGAREHMRAAAVALGPRVDYAEIRSTAEALLRELGWGLSAEPDDDPVFIPGRGARILAVRGEERLAVGSMGELHPEVLETQKLVHPTAALTLDLDALGCR